MERLVRGSGEPGDGRQAESMSGRISNRFDWQLVLALAPLGLLFAALTITRTIHGLGVTQWVALGLLTIGALTVAWRVPERPFRQGLVAGFLMSLVAIETQGIFIGTYLANNPEYAGLEMPLGLSPRLATMILGPINAVLAGLISGALAWLLWKALGGRSESSA